MTICFSKWLPVLHPRVFKSAALAIAEGGLKYELIDTAKNIWLRDFMPVKTAGGYTKFIYRTLGYDLHPVLHIPDDIGKEFNPKPSHIVLDGGNVVQCRSFVVMTDIVFKNNPNFSSLGLIESLEMIFGKKVVFIPTEPGDRLGHSDGVLKFFDNKWAFVNDYSMYGTKAMAAYGRKVEGILTDAGISVERIPYAYHKCPKIVESEFRKSALGANADDHNPGVGYYSNMVIAKRLVLLPVYGFTEDAEAIFTVKSKLPNHKICPIDCHDLSMLGGMLNCICWEKPEPTQ